MKDSHRCLTKIARSDYEKQKRELVNLAPSDCEKAIRKLAKKLKI